jgi:hypothetical protein
MEKLKVLFLNDLTDIQDYTTRGTRRLDVETNSPYCFGDE